MLMTQGMFRLPLRIVFSFSHYVEKSLSFKYDFVLSILIAQLGDYHATRV